MEPQPFDLTRVGNRAIAEALAEAKADLAGIEPMYREVYSAYLEHERRYLATMGRVRALTRILLHLNEDTLPPGTTSDSPGFQRRLQATLAALAATSDGER